MGWSSVHLISKLLSGQLHSKVLPPPNYRCPKQVIFPLSSDCSFRMNARGRPMFSSFLFDFLGTQRFQLFQTHFLLPYTGSGGVEQNGNQIQRNAELNGDTEKAKHNTSLSHKQNYFLDQRLLNINVHRKVL